MEQDIIDALATVLELAKQNVLDDPDPDLEFMVRDQEEAIDQVHRLVDGLYSMSLVLCVGAKI